MLSGPPRWHKLNFVLVRFSICRLSVGVFEVGVGVAGGWTGLDRLCQGSRHREDGTCLSKDSIAKADKVV